MTTISSTSSSLNPQSSPQITTGLVENLTLVAANTEYSHTFPPYTKAFLIRARTPANLKLAYDPGQTGVTYRTIPAGAATGWSNIGSATTKIFLQSTAAGVVVELESWV